MTAAVLMGGAAFAQQAPVSRQEFAQLFEPIAVGYTATKVVPASYAADRSSVLRAEVADMMLAVAVAFGKNVGNAGTALERLRLAGILAPDSSMLTEPGLAFRPQDLVRALAEFSDGMANTTGGHYEYQRD